MGVPCPGCGRQYDVTLFEFGRTIHCRCGARVGLAARVRSARGESGRRFIADAMLGSLARWLRMLGIDCAYQEDIADAELVRRALEEDRLVLTRDRALPREWRLSGVHLVEAERTLEQLGEVVDRFGLAGSLRPFTRCSLCNAGLVRAAPEEVAGRVPSRVLARQREFRRCPDCGRVYWRGSHTERMRRLMREVTGSE